MTERTAPRLLLIIVVAAYAVYFSHLTLTRYAAFEARALDLGNLNQAIWNTAHGDWFHQTNQPGATNRLSLHVEPILLPISLLYWIHAGPETLLILQAIVVALGAIPLFALGRRVLESEWLALLFAVAFLLSPAIQGANWLEFHPLTLAPTFLIAAFYFLISGRALWFAFFALLAAGCKEEIGLLIFMIGLYAGLVRKRWRWAAPTMILGAGWSLFAVLIIQNSVGGNYHWGRYAYLGDTPQEIITTLLTQPSLVIAQLTSADVFGYLAQLLLPVGFLALLAPEVLLLALPSLAINLLADFPPMHQVDTLIYAAPIAPFVVLAAVMGTARLLRRLNDANQRRARDLLAIAIIVAACLFVAQRLYGYLPGGANYRLYDVTDHHRRAVAVISQIAPDDAVSSQDKLNPHVSGRPTSYIFPRIFDSEVGDANVVFVDASGPAWPQHPNDVYSTTQSLLAADWGVAAADDGYLLLKQGAPEKELPASFYTVWNDSDPAARFPQQVDFGDELRLLGYDVVDDAHGELVVKLVWQALRPIARDLKFHVSYLDPASGDVLHENQFYQPVATLWYPTSMWQTGSPVVVQTLPWTLDADRFTLLLSVYEGDDPANALPVTSAQPALILPLPTQARLGAFQRDDAGWTKLPVLSAPPTSALDVQFGEQIALDGVTITRCRECSSTTPGGDGLALTLHWRALAPPAADYSAFVHLLAANGDKLAQLDWSPGDVGGSVPTSRWLVGQSMVDSRTLDLPADLPSGDYQLIAGLYDWRSGERLPTIGAQATSDNAVRLGMFNIR
jgi:uncharacterized membrane protein